MSTLSPPVAGSAPAALSPAPTAHAAHSPPPHAVLIEMVSSVFVARALYAAAELGVADHLAGGARTAEEVAPAVGAHAPSLHRLLRALAAVGVFTEETPSRFALTPLGAALRSDAPGAARSSLRTLGGAMFWRTFGEILHSVRTGETATERAVGAPIFDYLSARPEEAVLFGETMLGFHGAEPPAVAAAYDFSEIGTLVDVGGGIGTLLGTVLGANPQTRGVLYDLPHVVADARPRLEAAGLAERCTIVGGDFFASVPAGGDAYVLSHIIHDWDEGRCRTILANCRQAMNGRGRLLLVEAVLPPGDTPHPGKFLDLVMLTFTGGRERTEAEYAALLAGSGFTLTRVTPTASMVSVVEAVPSQAV